MSEASSMAKGLDKMAQTIETRFPSARQSGPSPDPSMTPDSILYSEDEEEIKRQKDQEMVRMAQRSGGMAALLNLFKGQSKDDIAKARIDSTMSHVNEAHKSLDDYGHYVSIYNRKASAHLDLAKDTPGGQILERLAVKPGPDRNAAIAALADPAQAARLGLSPDDLDTVREHVAKVGATPDVVNARRGMELSSASYAASMSALTNDMDGIASKYADDPQTMSAFNRARTGIEDSMRNRIEALDMQPVKLDGEKSGGPLAAFGEAFENFAKNMEETMRNIAEAMGRLGSTMFGQRQ